MSTDNIIILDGGMGDELRAKFPDTPWSPLALRDDGDHVIEMHLAYINAGATVIETWNYSATPYWLSAQDLKEGTNISALTEELVRLSVRHAIRARELSGKPNIRIAGSLPPLGASHSSNLPMDEKTNTHLDLVQEYKKIATYLVEEGVDILLAETCALCHVAKAAAQAARAVAPELDLWISFSLQDKVPVLWSGESLQMAVQCCKDNNAQAILFNCSPPEIISQAIGEIRPLFANRIGGYANSRGQRQAYTVEIAKSQAGKTSHVYGERVDLDPKGYSQWTDDWIRKGASIIGGCCGIGPSHITACAHTHSGTTAVNASSL